MWKTGLGSLMLFVSLFFVLEAWTYWDQLATWQSFFLGIGCGGFLAAGLCFMFWRPSHPATRYKVDHPSPWDRGRWR